LFAHKIEIFSVKRNKRLLCHGGAEAASKFVSRFKLTSAGSVPWSIQDRGPWVDVKQNAATSHTRCIFLQTANRRDPGSAGGSQFVRLTGKGSSGSAVLRDRASQADLFPAAKRQFASDGSKTCVASGIFRASVWRGPNTD
jgi:hypothetical protein